MPGEKESVSPPSKILPMIMKDVEKVMEIGFNTPEFETGTGAPQFYSREALERMVKSEDCIMLTARVEGELAGFIMTTIMPASRDAYIHTIVVKRSLRKQGIASQLLEEALTRIEKRPEDCNHVYCDIRTDNEISERFFRKHGFTIGETFHYADLMFPRSK